MSDAPAAQARKTHTGLVVTGLLLGILLYAIDQSIVGTSLFTITRDIGGFEHFAWLFSAYMLASTVVIPIAGKLSDIYGRRPIYMLGMGIFLLGSVLCGTATDMAQLIAYRAVQGLGGGALFPVALATIADLFPPSERGKIGGLFGSVFGISSVIGPFVGGWLVDHAHIGSIDSWRWVFYVNVPVGIVGIAFVGAYFPRVETRAGATIDYAGIATITLGLLSGLLVAVWGGDAYAWGSWQIAALAVTSALAFAAFFLLEQRAKDPILPLALFRNPIFSVSAAASLVSGAVMFSVISFMPTYMQGVVGLTPTYAGTTMVPLSIGIVAGVASSGGLMKRFGYKPFAVGGFLIAIVGYLLLAMLGHRPNVGVAVAEMLLLGIGVGFTLQTFVIATQNSVERRDVGVGTASLTLFRTLGATIGVTILGVILNRRIEAEATARIAPEWIARLLAIPELDGKVANIPTVLRIPEALERISAAPGGPETIEAIKASFAEGMTLLFLISAGLSVVGLLIAAMLKSIPMKTAEEYHGTASA